MGWRTLVVLWQSIARLDKGSGVLSLVLAGVGLGTWSTFLPWWTPWAAFGILLLIGFLRANYEELQELASDNKELEDELEGYKNSGTPKVVTRLDNPGPVSIEEWAPDVLQEGENDSVCVVPYKPYGSVSAFFDAPAFNIKVEDAEDVYLIVVDYEVRGENQPHPEGKYPMQTDVGARASSADGQTTRDLHVHMGVAWVPEDGSWKYAVHGNGILSGLPEGTYGLNVFDIVDVSANKRDARREYRDMRLRITRQ